MKGSGTAGASETRRGRARSHRSLARPPEDSLTLVFRALIFAPRKVGPPRVECRKMVLLAPRCCAGCVFWASASLRSADLAREATLGARTNLRGAIRAAQNVVGPPEDSLTLAFRAPIFASRKVGPPRVELYLARLSGSLPPSDPGILTAPRSARRCSCNRVGRIPVGPPRVELGSNAPHAQRIPLPHGPVRFDGRQSEV